MKKTVALISDMHCGHIFGLCPEPYQIKEPKDKVGYPNLVMLSKAQAEMWDTYLSFVEPFKGVDLLVCVGDMLDGTQKHSEGSELISLASDPGVQIDMAELAISQWQAKEEWYIAGTPYHSGKRTDWEERLAKKRSIVTNAHFSGENVFAIRDDDTGNSFKIHAKHHVGGSATLYGQASQTDKERASYLEASYIGGFPHVDLFVRGHVHKYSYVESIGPDERVTASMTLPALQGQSKFGIRRTKTRVVPFGFVVLVIEDGKIVDRTVKIKYLHSSIPEVYTV